MCSHTQADAEANTSTGLAEGSTMKAKSNMKNSDDRGKCKLDDAEFDELDAADGIKDASSLKSIEKKMKKAQPEPHTYMNPSSPSHPLLLLNMRLTHAPLPRVLTLQHPVMHPPMANAYFWNH